MPFFASHSTESNLTEALDELCVGLSVAEIESPDLVFVFFSPHYQDQAQTIVDTLQQCLKPGVLLGCMGEGVIGNAEELEDQAAIVLWAGKWNTPQTFHPFHLTLEQTSEGHSLLGWPDVMQSMDAKESAMLLLGDPYTFPVDAFFELVHTNYPGLRVMGGMSSGSRGAGFTRLILNDQVLDQGAIGILLEDASGVRSVVSQGCRPVGHHMVITKAEKNLILELGGHTAFEQLKNVWQSLTPGEQALFQQGPHIGRVINEYQGEFHRGDFLVRNILGVDQESGAMAITDLVRVGQTVQFHIRDAETADEDIRELLQADLQAADKAPAAALLFSCNGRGSRMFSVPDHDAEAVQSELGSIPVAGFFAAGELGPVGGQNFIHGFTASVVLFQDN